MIPLQVLAFQEQLLNALYPFDSIWVLLEAMVIRRIQEA